jgi:hypothetical protein
MPIEDEIRQLAVQLATNEDEDVRDRAATIVEQHRAAVRMTHALDGVDRMTQDDVAAVEELHDSLQQLLTWARESGRM